MTDETGQQPITEQQAEDIVRSFMQKNVNTHTFFTDIIKAKSTTKTGNLDISELGMPRITQRGLKELEAFCEDIFKEESWAKYFGRLAEIQTSTSLSKDAILIKLAVTTKKELADVSPEKKKKSGLFGKKEDKD